MTKTFYLVNMQYAGLCQAESRELCIIPTPTEDTISVTLTPVSGTASTFAARLRYSNAPYGPWQDYETAVALGASDLTSGLRAVLGQYAALVVTTGEAADVRFDVSFQARKQGGVAAGV